MVNYARMEPVFRSYGPLEPIGPSAKTPRRSGKRAVLLGVAVVCGAGAALGAYLRPDLDFKPPEISSAKASDAPARRPAQPQEFQLVLNELAPGILPAGGALPSETVPPSPAPLAAPLAPPAPMVVATAPSPASAPTLAVAMPSGRVHARIVPATAVAAEAPTPIRRTVIEATPVTPPYAAGPAARPAPRLVLASRTETPRPSAPQLPRVREAPSFDCNAARSTAQAMVCDSPALTALDRQMAAEYAATVSAGYDPARLQLDQDAWHARREAAAPDPDAVSDAYKRRIRKLRAMR